MDICVFGGSGVVGRALLPELIARGHTVRAMEHNRPIEAGGVEIVHGSITDPDAVAATLDGAEVVLQLTKGGSGIEQTVETSSRGTLNVLDAIRSADGVTQYVLASSDAAVGICSHSYEGPISHETPPLSYGDYYSLGKVLEETIVRDVDRNYGLPFTIARLSWTQREDLVLRHLIAGYDPERPTAGAWSGCYREGHRRRLEAGEPFVVLPTDAEGEPLARTLVSLRDVVAGLLAMIGNPAAAGQTFHLSAPAFTYDQPATYLAETLGLPVEAVVDADFRSYDIDFSHTTACVGWEPQDDVIDMIDAALAWRDAGANAG
jgi:nucleoside-diphosphate-sugar epimerase